MRFNHLFVIGGSPCSGKSTMAAHLATRFQLNYYKVDDHEEAHAAQIDPVRHPTMHRIAQMTWDEIWMRPIPAQAESELNYYRERFEFILADLAQFDEQKGLITEGAAFLPELINRLGVDPCRVIYLVPTAEFQLKHYRQRSWIQGILNSCNNPTQAFENWMARDQLFGQLILAQAESNGYETRIVDGTVTIDAQIASIQNFFNL